MDLEQKVAQWYARKDRLVRQCLVGLILTQVLWMVVFLRIRSVNSQPIWLGYSDPNGNLVLGPGQRITDAKSIHVEEAVQATKALFDRGPTTMDMPELIQAMYSSRGLATLETLRANETPEFAQKQLHQKAEIGPVEVIETRPDLVLVQVRGQLIRTGVVLQQVFTESVPFVLKLQMTPNRDVLKNRRRPLSVVGFQLSYEKQ